MDFENELFRFGVTTFTTDVVTLIPVNPQNEFQVGKILSTDIGFIYGITTYADRIDPTNTNLISTTQAQNLYFMGQNGPTQFLESMPLDDMLNVFSGTPEVRPQKYLRVNIPYFDLSKSKFQNPTLISSAGGNINIRLKFWYIQKNSWEKIKEHLFPKK